MADKDLNNFDSNRDQDVNLYLIDFGLATQKEESDKLAGTKLYIHP